MIAKKAVQINRVECKYFSLNNWLIGNLVLTFSAFSGSFQSPAKPIFFAIKFNRTLLLENSDEFIRQVVPHELAHLIVYQVFGRVKPHGQEWKAVMTQLFNLPADTCHQFDVESVQGKMFAYQCECQTHYLTIRRHNRIQRDKIAYLCRKCQGKLVFHSENS